MRISIDGHDLHVVGADGHNVHTHTVESVIVQPGERYDIWLNTTDSLQKGNYWIRAETLEYSQDGMAS